MNSHVQIPKVILKQFADPRNSLHYYDFQTNCYKLARAKSFNTVTDYFDEDLEQFLSDAVESRMGKIIKYLKNDDFTETDPPKNYDKTIKDYIYSLICRDPNMIDEVNKNSVFFNS